MRFRIVRHPQTTLFLFMRKCGYRYLSQKGIASGSFVRFLSSTPYPRFHIYETETDDYWELNLHLDQRRPVYKGARAHGGEYEGKVVEQEQKRIEETMREQI